MDRYGAGATHRLLTLQTVHVHQHVWVTVTWRVRVLSAPNKILTFYDSNNLMRFSASGAIMFIITKLTEEFTAFCTEFNSHLSTILCRTDDVIDCYSLFPTIFCRTDDNSGLPFYPILASYLQTWLDYQHHLYHCLYRVVISLHTGQGSSLAY